MPIVEPSWLSAPAGLTPQTVLRMNGSASPGHLFFKGCCEPESGTEIKETLTTNIGKASCCSKSYFLQLGFQRVPGTSWERRGAERAKAFCFRFFFFFNGGNVRGSCDHCKVS